MNARFVVGADGQWSHPPRWAERGRNTNLGTVKQVLTRGFARTSEFRWKANRRVRCSYPISPATALSVADDDCVTIDHIWGVIDTVPETNFPDIRNRCVIHSESGSCMVIPREGDKVRLYIQLSDKQVVDPATGRVDKNRVSPDHLLQVEIWSCIHSCHGSLSFNLQAAKKILRPYTIVAREVDWWTIYISTSLFTPYLWRVRS